jgi:hypothetical protein
MKTAATPAPGNGTEVQAARSIESLLGDEYGDDEDKETPEGEETLGDETTVEGDESDETEGTDEEEGLEEDLDEEPEGGKAASAKLPEKFTVKLSDGKDVEVDQDKLGRGILLMEDYTKKTTALSDKERAVQAKEEALEAEYAPLIAALRAKLEGELATEPDWAKLKDEDPIGFAVQRQEWRDKQELAAQAKAEDERLQADAQKKRDVKRTEILAEESKRILEVLPAWKDPKVAEKEQKVIRSFLREEGFDDAEIDSVADHRLVKVLRKAVLYDQLKKRGKSVIRPVPEATVRPGGGKETKQGSYKAARKRLKATGDEDAAVASLLSGGFLKDMD